MLFSCNDFILIISKSRRTEYTFWARLLVNDKENDSILQRAVLIIFFFQKRGEKKL